MENSITDLFHLVPLRQHELGVGKPLPRPVYDWHGKLLLAAGIVIETQKQIDELAKHGFVHDARWGEMAAKRPAAPTETKTRVNIPASPSRQDKEILMEMIDVKWTVGETLYLQSADHSEIRYNVRLIGFVKNKTVFVTAPMLEGKFEFIREGQTFIARAFAGKKAFAFVCSAVKSMHVPHPYLLLSYPRQVRCTVVRRGIRAQVKLIAALAIENPPRVIGATLTDLSTGGASCATKEPVGQHGDVIRIKFKVHVADNDEYLDLAAILRSVAASENGEGVKHGFEFLDVSVQEKLILSAFVHQTVVEAD
jgi:c-di-GMP-binding flagellar brake protein YcgR